MENGTQHTSDFFDFQYKIIISNSSGNLLDQVNDCLDQLKIISLKLNDETAITRANWFYRKTEEADCEIIHGQVSDLINHKELGSIPYSIVGEQPIGDSLVELVIFLVSNFSGKFLTRKLPGSDSLYCVVSHNDQKWVFAGGYGSYKGELSTRDSSHQAFSQLSDILKNEKLSFRNLIRQWNYIPDITGINFNINDKIAQNYQEFNDVRAYWYLNDNLDKDFPAATGIGVSGGGVGIDLIALFPGLELKIYSLHNPDQADAHKYSTSKLIGDNAIMTPRFERGKLVFCHRKGHIWVSGTAAIKGEESIKGNVLDQTALTCDNIDQLISLENLIRSGLPDQAYSIKGLYIRGYVKDESDGESVQNFLRTKYPDALVHVLKADVCREELLVEIEGEFGIVTNDE